LASVQGGQQAAIAVVQLMQQTFARIAPMTIVEAYVETDGDKPAPRADALWEKFGDDTAQVMADGCCCLAGLWESAWKEGNGDKNVKDLGEIDADDPATIYQDPAFLPSKTLNTIKPLL